MKLEGKADLNDSKDVVVQLTFSDNKDKPIAKLDGNANACIERQIYRSRLSFLSEILGDSTNTSRYNDDKQLRIWEFTILNADIDSKQFKYEQTDTIVYTGYYSAILTIQEKNLAQFFFIFFVLIDLDGNFLTAQATSEAQDDTPAYATEDNCISRAESEVRFCSDQTCYPQVYVGQISIPFKRVGDADMTKSQQEIEANFIVKPTRIKKDSNSSCPTTEEAQAYSKPDYGTIGYIQCESYNGYILTIVIFTIIMIAQCKIVYINKNIHKYGSIIIIFCLSVFIFYKYVKYQLKQKKKMQGMKFVSEQYYSYQDLQSQQDIIKVDSIGNVHINEDEQIIEYQIDRSKCLRLSDLIYMITENYIQFRLGQLLMLFNNLLTKVIEQLNKHKINHQYLDDNRIWLMFKDNNRCIHISYSTIDYEIAFTGYQCQLYEQNQDLVIPAEQKIQQIIKDILTNFKQNNIFINNSKKDQIIKQIYDPIIQQCDKLNINNTQDLIFDILKNLKYNSQQQTIELDDTSISLNQSARFIKTAHIYNYWKDLMTAIKGENYFIIENVINTRIKFVAQRAAETLTKLIWKDETLNDLVKSLKSHYDKLQSQFNTESIIKQQFENILNEQMENYKFDISLEEKKSIIENTLKRLNNQKLIKYFQNSVHYYLRIKSDQMQQIQLKLIAKQSELIIKEEVELLIDLKILELINELI